MKLSNTAEKGYQHYSDKFGIHIVSREGNIRKYLCSICKKEFFMRQTLLDHKRSDHAY
jgi:hypothetical protein